MTGHTKLEVLLFIPNLIGYLRLLLIGISWIYIDNYHIFLPVYVLSIILDATDGWAARKYNQVSDFGAWLDVMVDLIGRGMVWSYISKFGYLIIAFEWMVFVGNSERAKGSQWKKSFEEAPTFVQLVMEKGFKTPLGYWTIFGLHVLPPWLYALSFDVFKFLPYTTSLAVSLVLISGRILCGSVEVWCVWKYVELLLSKSCSSEQE